MKYELLMNTCDYNNTGPIIRIPVKELISSYRNDIALCYSEINFATHMFSAALGLDEMLNDETFQGIMGTAHDMAKESDCCLIMRKDTLEDGPEVITYAFYSSPNDATAYAAKAKRIRNRATRMGYALRKAPGEDRYLVWTIDPETKEFDNLVGASLGYRFSLDDVSNYLDTLTQEAS